MPLVPIHRLRKGAIFIAVLLFSFVFYRLAFFKEYTEPALPEQGEPSMHTEMCLLISESGPVNIDTVFNIKNINSKVYAYSFLDTGFNVVDTIWHVWYKDSEIIKNVACNIDSLSCTSSISLDSLKVGFWSVDTRQNDILIDVKQFKIN